MKDLARNLKSQWNGLEKVWKNSWILYTKLCMNTGYCNISKIERSWLLVLAVYGDAGLAFKNGC